MAKAQEILALLQGQTEANSGEEFLRALVRLSTEQVLPETLEREQAAALGRDRYERRETARGYRNGQTDGTLKTAEGVLRVNVPQVRGGDSPYHSQVWADLAKTSDRLKTLMVEMFVGGMAQRDIDATREKALGQCVLSTSAISPMTDTLQQADEAVRTRDLSGYELASLCIDAVYEPRRRWGSQTGVLCVWGMCLDGRKVFLSLSTAHSESYDRGLEVLRDLVTRGLQTPGTMTTDGAPGWIKAVDFVWPRSLRLRCWFPKRQNLGQKGPPPAWPAFKALGADRRDAPTFAEGQRRMPQLLDQYQDTCPEACQCLAEDGEARLHHLKVPPRHRQYGRTSNRAERAFEAERRRTKVLPQLWDEQRLLKLVFAVLIRLSERWGKKQYSEFEQHQIRALRQALELDQQRELPSLGTMAPQNRRSAASARYILQGN